MFDPPLLPLLSLLLGEGVPLGAGVVEGAGLQIC
jgi:hypothetical protein